MQCEGDVCEYSVLGEWIRNEWGTCDNLLAKIRWEGIMHARSCFVRVLFCVLLGHENGDTTVLVRRVQTLFSHTRCGQV